MTVFTKCLLNKGHILRIYDVDRSRAQKLAENNNCFWFDSLHWTVSDVDMVLLCTPIKETPKTIMDVMPYMKKGSIMCEMASLKMKTVSMLKVAEEYDVQPLSVHPMFGPDIKTIEGQTLAVVPVLNKDIETELARSFFPDTKIVVVNAETHDYCMASVLSLPYFMNLVFARVLSPEKLSFMRELAGTTFSVQLAVAQSIVGESPELIESLINDNMFSEELMNRFIDEFKYIRKLLKSKPHEMRCFFEKLRDSMMKDSEFINARKKRNDFFELIRT